MFFFLKLDHHTGGTSADVVYPPGEKLFLFSHFCSSQRFA